MKFTQQGWMGKRYKKSLKAFTLVELSIVIIIIGLLIAGVASGTSLIKTSTLNAVYSEYQKYLLASQAFYDKYGQLPGDMPNASSFWPSCVAPCDGNGNGVLDSVFNYNQELGLYWYHLSLSGVLNQNFVPSLDGAGCIAIGSAVPGSVYKSKNPGRLYWAVSGYVSFFTLSANPAAQCNITQGYTDAVAPSDMQIIDSKFDDGLPYTGQIRGNTGSYYGGGGWHNACVYQDGNGVWQYYANNENTGCNTYWKIGLWEPDNF